MSKLSISIDQSYVATGDAAKRRRICGPVGDVASLRGIATRPPRNRAGSWLIDAISILVIVAAFAAIYARS